MKPRLAAVLSIVGVLSAGSAAALVNTQVLQSDSAAGETAAVTTAFSPPALTAVDPAVTVSSTNPGTSASSTTTATSLVVDTSATTVTSPFETSVSSSIPSSLPVENTSPTAVTSTTVDSITPTTVTSTAVGSGARSTGVYQLGDGGTVTLSAVGDVLTIVAVEPAPGWEVHDADNENAHNIEVRLRNEDREIRFEANLLFGVVSTSLGTDDD